MTDHSNELYETLDMIHEFVDDAGGAGTLASLLMQLTGTTVEDHGPQGPVFVLNPDDQSAARSVALRWLRDRGYQRA